MITRRVKVQLAIFVIGSLIAATFVGFRYARIDRLFGSGYDITVKMAEGGGIFATADVTYRGVSVGRVTDMTIDGDGVDLTVHIEAGAPRIPANTEAVVASRSAVGEQFLDFQPRQASGPYLARGAVVDRQNTKIPVDTRELLTNVNALLASVNPQDLNTVVTELGTAFAGADEDLSTILRSSNSFVTTADQKYEITAGLIRSSATALQTQVDSADSISTFAKNLQTLTHAVRISDPDLRKVLDVGAPTAQSLRTLLDENADDLSSLLANSVRLNRVVVTNLDGIRDVLVIAPAGVESAYSIMVKDSRTGQYGLRLGLTLTNDKPVCTEGYRAERRPPENLTPEKWNRSYTCASPLPRGVAGGKSAASSASASGDGSVVLGTYDVATGALDTNVAPETIADAPDLGKDAWKWTMLAPAVSR